MSDTGVLRFDRAIVVINWFALNDIEKRGGILYTPGNLYEDVIFLRIPLPKLLPISNIKHDALDLMSTVLPEVDQYSLSATLVQRYNVH